MQQIFTMFTYTQFLLHSLVWSFCLHCGSHGILLASLILCCKTRGIYSWRSVYHSRTTGLARLCRPRIFFRAYRLPATFVRAISSYAGKLAIAFRVFCPSLWHKMLTAKRLTYVNHSKIFLKDIQLPGLGLFYFHHPPAYSQISHTAWILYLVTKVTGCRQAKCARSIC